jgi:hypothetical protein
MFWFVPVPYTRIVNPWKVIRFPAAAMKSCPCGMSEFGDGGVVGLGAQQNNLRQMRQNETRPSGKLGRAGTEVLEKSVRVALDAVMVVLVPAVWRPVFCAEFLEPANQARASVDHESSHGDLLDRRPHPNLF